MNISISGTDKIVKSLGKHLDTKAALQKSLLLVEGQAKEDCPVDTGRLRASISSKLLNDNEGIVYTNVEYGPYVEYGTRHQQAQPFMRTAVPKQLDNIIKAFKEE